MAISDKKSLLEEGEFRGQVLAKLGTIEAAITSLTQNASSQDSRLRTVENLQASQAGAIQVLTANVSENSKDIENLKSYKYWLMGVGALLVLLLTLFATIYASLPHK